MDLTNIKPCKECRKLSECQWRFRTSFSEDGFIAEHMALERVKEFFVFGRDCFEEVKSNAEV